MSAIIKAGDFKYSLESAVTGIAMEANLLADTLQTIKKFVPSLIHGVKDKVHYIFSKFGKIEEITKDQRKAIELLKSAEYTTLADLSVFVNEGYQGKLVDYVDALDKVVDHMFSVVNIVKEYKTFLSIILTNKEKQKSLEDSRFIYNNSQDEGDNIDHLLVKFNKKNSYKTKVTFKEVFDRNSDVEVFIKKMQALRRKVDTIDLNALKNDVDTTTSILDMFIKQVTSGDISDVSPEVLKNLSTGAYQVAKDVEWFAAGRYRIIVATSTVNTLVEKLTKLNIN